MARYEHLPIYKKALDVSVHFEKVVAGFSKRRVRIAHAVSFSRITDHLAWIDRPVSKCRVGKAQRAHADNRS